MGVIFTNNAEGTLVAGINDSVTTLTLDAGQGALFPVCAAGPTDYFYATLVNTAGTREIIKVTQRTGDVFDVIERGVDDSSAAAFALGSKVQLRLVKIILEDFRDDIDTNTSGVAANLAAIGTNDTDIAALQARDTADEQKLYAPTGLTIWIYNPSGEIPTGWSAKAGPADCLLAVAGGAQAYNVAGENLAGSWTPTGHTHTGPSHTHTTPDIAHTHTTPAHALTSAELPSHAHTEKYYALYSGVGLGSDGAFQGYGVAASITTTSSGLTGSNNAHAHGNTGSAGSAGVTGAEGTGATGSSTDPSTDRPYAAVGLLIERD